MTLKNELPQDITEKLMSLLHKVDGEYEIKNPLDMAKFVLEYGGKYPSLYEFLQLDEEEVVRIYEETGSVPPGVQLVKTTTTEGSNVTNIDFIKGD